MKSKKDTSPATASSVLGQGRKSSVHVAICWGGGILTRQPCSHYGKTWRGYPEKRLSPEWVFLRAWGKSLREKGEVRGQLTSLALGYSQ